MIKKKANDQKSYNVKNSLGTHGQCTVFGRTLQVKHHM